MNQVIISQTEIPTLEPTSLLEDWSLDYEIYSLKYPTFTNRFAMWQRFIRS